MGELPESVKRRVLVVLVNARAEMSAPRVEVRPCFLWRFRSEPRRNSTSGWQRRITSASGTRRRIESLSNSRGFENFRCFVVRLFVRVRLLDRGKKITSAPGAAQKSISLSNSRDFQDAKVCVRLLDRQKKNCLSNSRDFGTTWGRPPWKYTAVVNASLCGS